MVSSFGGISLVEFLWLLPGSDKNCTSSPTMKTNLKFCNFLCITISQNILSYSFLACAIFWWIYDLWWSKSLCRFLTILLAQGTFHVEFVLCRNYFWDNLGLSEDNNRSTMFGLKAVEMTDVKIEFISSLYFWGFPYFEMKWIPLEASKGLCMINTGNLIKHTIASYSMLVKCLRM